MNRLARRLVVVVALVGCSTVSLLSPAPSANAVDVFQQACPSPQGGGTAGNSAGTGTNNGGNAGSSGSSNGVCGATSSDNLEGFTKSIINTLLYVIGIIGVIMIIIGGIRYTTSNGDANQTKSAKDTILYSVVGIVVAIMAFAIVNFVVGRFG